MWTKVKRRAGLELGLPHTGEEVQETEFGRKDLQGSVGKACSQAALAMPVDMLTHPGEKLSLAASTLQCKWPKSR